MFADTMTHGVTDRLITRLCLSLYASARRYERTPKVRTYSTRELVALVAYAPRHGLYESERAFAGLASESEGGAL